MSVNEWKEKSQTDAIMELLKKVNKEILIMQIREYKSKKLWALIKDGCTDGKRICINISENSLKEYFSVLTGRRIYVSFRKVCMFE